MNYNDLFEVELFDLLTVYKQMTHLIELLLIFRMLETI